MTIGFIILVILIIAYIPLGVIIELTKKYTGTGNSKRIRKRKW